VLLVTVAVRLHWRSQWHSYSTSDGRSYFATDDIATLVPACGRSAGSFQAGVGRGL